MCSELYCEISSCRDIKCANILVHANGSVKLADFGLAKEVCYSACNLQNFHVFCSIYPLLLFSDIILFYQFSYRLPNSVRSNHAKELFIGWHRRYANIILLVHYLHIRLLEYACICLFILCFLSMICLE